MKKHLMAINVISLLVVIGTAAKRSPKPAKAPLENASPPGVSDMILTVPKSEV